jgi:VWFA-related protein
MTRPTCVRRRRARFAAFSTAITITITAAATVIAQTSQFRSAVTHVLLDVVVTDKDDRPVTDLTADDFEIVDHGKVQTIADFEAIRVPLADRRIENLKAIPSPPPDTFTNAPPPHSGRAFVIWIDAIDLGNFVVTKRVLTEFVRSLSPDDRIAVTYGSRSDVAQDFTSDTGLVMRAFDRLVDGVVAVHEDPADTLENIVNNLTDAPELRRALIVVSESVPWDPAPPIKRLHSFFLEAQRARRAGIPVYVIDPAGLQAPTLMLQGHLEDQKAEYRMLSQHAAFDNQQKMRSLSEYTGGRALVSMPDVVKAARELVEDTSSYYLLGFYPDPYAADGKFHEVEVRARRKGLHVRARLGYTAESKKPARALPLVSTLGAGLPGGDLVIRTLAVPVAPGGKGVTTWITADVSYPESAGGARRADDLVDVAWIAIDPDARVRARGQRSVRVPLGNAPASAFTLMLNDVIDLPLGDVTVRLAVSSRTLGTRGTVHVPVSVRRLDGKAIEATPLVFGAATPQPARMAKLTAQKDVLPFQPSTRRRFAADAELRVWSRVFAHDAVTAEMTVKDGDATIRTLTVNTAAAKAKNATDCDATLSLEGLAPGNYVLEYVARAGKTETRRAVPFEVARPDLEGRETTDGTGLALVWAAFKIKPPYVP